MATEREGYSKGGGLIPTIDGNLQFGPSAEEVQDKEDVSTTSMGREVLFNKFGLLAATLKPYYEKPDESKIIVHFAGCRAATYKEDFIIEPSKKVKGLNSRCRHSISWTCSDASHRRKGEKKS